MNIKNMWFKRPMIEVKNFLKSRLVFPGMACLVFLSACNLNTSSENVMDEQSTEVPEEIKDSPLKVSEVYGVDIVVLGKHERFFVDITDEDGIASVKFELRDKTGKVVKTFPYIKDNKTYKMEMNTEGLKAGDYDLVVTAVGVDGGVGDSSGKKESVLSLELSDKVITNAGERF